MFRCHQEVLSIPAHTDIKFDAKLLESGSMILVQKVIFSHDSSQLASLGWNGSVKVWHAKGGHRLFVLGGTNRPVTAIAFNPSSPQLAVAFSDGAAEVWSTGSWQKQWDFRSDTGKVKGLVYRSDGVSQAVRLPKANGCSALGSE